MKKLFFATIMLVSFLGFNHYSFASNNEPVKKTEISSDDADRAKVLNDRLNEINDMDKSALTASERRELRKEVRSIKEELAQISGGVYLSIGAIIVILLLLILLL